MSAAWDVVTFGETMIRLNPPGKARLESADSLELRVGGSESNTACALARLGRRVRWWSKLPANPLGRRIEQSIRRWGVDTSLTLWEENGRAGLYFIEFGSPPRPHCITYDRAGSSASRLDPGEVDWDHLHDARHLHLTGITPALSASCAATVLQAAQLAESKGLTVSFDVNYRSKLWSGYRAAEAIEPILKHVDLLICAARDAAEVFGLTVEPEAACRTLYDRYGVPNTVVTASEQGVWAVRHVNSRTNQCYQPPIPAAEIDRVGAGDAFSAGVIDGFLDGDLQRGLFFGVAMASLKHTIPGDELIATRAEIEALASGGEPHIQR